MIYINASDQFLSLYGRLIESINRVKHRLGNHDQSESKAGRETAGSRDLRDHKDRVQEHSQKPRDTGYQLQRISRGSSPQGFMQNSNMGDCQRNLMTISDINCQPMNEMFKRTNETSINMELDIVKAIDESLEKGNDSPKMKSEVFDKLLLRLDKLKDTLDINRSGFDPQITSKSGTPHKSGRVRDEDNHHSAHVFEEDCEDENTFPIIKESQARSTTKYSISHGLQELSPIGLQRTDHSLEDHSKAEILDIMNGGHVRKRETYSKIQVHSLVVNNQQSPQGIDLEYSASKKESYTSQIDNFLTNETNLLKSVQTRHEISASQCLNRWKKSSDGQMRDLVPITTDFNDEYSDKPKYKQSDKFTIPQHNEYLDKENSNPNKQLKHQNRNDQQNKHLSSETSTSPYFARLMQDYGYRHQEDEVAYQKRELRFQQIKKILDKEERLRSRERRGSKDTRKLSKSRPTSRLSKERDNSKIQKLQEKLSHIDEKLNQFEVNFKNDDELMITWGKEKYEKIDENRNRTSYSRVEDQKCLSRKSSKWHQFESKHSDEGNSMDGIYKGQHSYKSHHSDQHSSKYESVKPPVSFVVPLNKGEELIDGSTLREAYSKFMAQRKSQRSLHRQSEYQSRDSEMRSHHHERMTTAGMSTNIIPIRRASLSPVPAKQSPAVFMRGHPPARHPSVEDLGKNRRSTVRTEVEIQNAKVKKLKAVAKQRNERIKNYDASRRHVNIN